MRHPLPTLSCFLLLSYLVDTYVPNSRLITTYLYVGSHVDAIRAYSCGYECFQGIQRWQPMHSSEQ